MILILFTMQNTLTVMQIMDDPAGEHSMAVDCNPEGVAGERISIKEEGPAGLFLFQEIWYDL